MPPKAPPAPPPDPLDEGAMSVPRAVKFTGLSRSQIYRLMDGGQLGWTKVGGRRLVVRSSLKALLRKGLVLAVEGGAS